jgi:chaperonin GroES
MNNLRAPRGKILVKRDEREEKTESGLIIPDVAKTWNYFGTVVSVGSPKVNKQTGKVFPVSEVKEGDRVMFDKVIDKIICEGVSYLVMEEKHIAGVLE